MLRYLQNIPRFILVSKTLARPGECVINEDLKSINQWFSNNGLICNTKKTVTMVIASHRAVKTARDVRISYGDSLLEQKRFFNKYLCVIVDESFSWNSYISYVASRVYPKHKLLNRISSFLDPTTLLKIYFIKRQFYLF